jgi:hypothetical protein
LPRWPVKSILVKEKAAPGGAAKFREETSTAAHGIPPDSVGGFIYTGGPLQLADLADHGVRYAGLTGVEWHGWSLLLVSRFRSGLWLPSDRLGPGDRPPHALR